MKKFYPKKILGIYIHITEEGQGKLKQVALGPKKKKLRKHKTKTEHNKEILTASDLGSQESSKRIEIDEEIMKILLRIRVFFKWSVV